MCTGQATSPAKSEYQEEVREQGLRRGSQHPHEKLGTALITCNPSTEGQGRQVNAESLLVGQTNWNGKSLVEEKILSRGNRVYGVTYDMQ